MQTWELIAWTSKPLIENPRRPPMDELNPHKLCMSEASAGWFILFCATQASIVTSAIAAPALPAVMAIKANTTCSLLCRESVSIEITPTRPVFTKKYSVHIIPYAIKGRKIFWMKTTVWVVMETKKLKKRHQIILSSWKKIHWPKIKENGKRYQHIERLERGDNCQSSFFYFTNLWVTSLNMRRANIQHMKLEEN